MNQVIHYFLIWDGKDYGVTYGDPNEAIKFMQEKLEAEVDVDLLISMINEGEAYRFDARNPVTGKRCRMTLTAEVAQLTTI